jgi:hypothetical protein
MAGDFPTHELNPKLIFRPIPVGDPTPEIFDLLRELRDPGILRDAIRVVLDSQIAIAKLNRQIEGKRVDGLTKLRDTVAKG